MRHRPIELTIPASILAGALALSGDVRAQNLVTNGAFDIPPGDTTGWSTFQSPEFLTFQFFPLDVAGRPDSGSMQVTVAGSGAGQGGGVLQCLSPVAAGGSYDFGAVARIPSGQSRTGDASLLLVWFSDPSCATGISGTSSPLVTSATPDAWLPSTARGQVAPAGTRSARIGLLVSKNEAGGSFSALFDDVFFGPAHGFFTVDPCRIVDTRPNGLVSGPWSLEIVGACGVPATATSVAVNLTVTESTAAGDLRAYPMESCRMGPEAATCAGGVPQTSVLNFGPDQSRANNAILRLGCQGRICIYTDIPGNESVAFILDVTGYFQ